MKKLSVIVIGAGGRGRNYTDIMSGMPEKYEVVGVAEPIESRREYIKNKHNVAEEHCFDTWEKILDIPKFADIAIISTMDRMHFEPAMKAIQLGYDLLLEKPAAPTAEECYQLAAEAKKYGTKILVCHVLRYTPVYTTMKQIIDNGEIGKVMSIQHAECVGNVHQSHSFVRGNWGNADRSTTMLLQKSCHDIDILQWLIGKKCKRVSSFGSLSHFTRDNAPEGSPERCIEGCPHADTCYYNAKYWYVDLEDNFWFRSSSTGLANPTTQDAIDSMYNTQYGKCVYKCDNNVVDHQVVNLEFEDGTLVDFNMCAFNEGGRFTRIMGTKGEIVRREEGNTLEVYHFDTRKSTTVDVASYGNSVVDGHGGGDAGIIRALYDYMTTGEVTEQLSEIAISAENHMIVFAAEKSRLEGKIIDIDEFVKSL